MFGRILIPLDQSPLAEEAIARGAMIARATGATIDVVLVHVPVTTTVGARDLLADAQAWDAEHRYVESIVDELSTGAQLPATHGILRGDPIDMICRRAHETQADLIVMTSHGRTGLRRAWLGSVADGVIRRSSVPVLMLRPRERSTHRLGPPRTFGHILIPLDTAPACDDLLTATASLARCGAESVTLLHVVQPVPRLLPESYGPMMYPPPAVDDELTQQLVDEAMAALDRLARRFFEQVGIRAHVEVVVDASVSQAILEFTRTHATDLVAMATHGRSVSRLLMGSVTDRLLRASSVPMLVHRPLPAKFEPREEAGALTALPTV